METGFWVKPTFRPEGRESFNVKVFDGNALLVEVEVSRTAGDDPYSGYVAPEDVDLEVIGGEVRYGRLRGERQEPA